MGISLGLKLKDRVHEKDRLALKKEAVMRFASADHGSNSWCEIVTPLSSYHSTRKGEWAR
jgi:hypothetical protein